MNERDNQDTTKLLELFQQKRKMCKISNII